eukprot:1159009-Pelagomonas_calceolata.AAC.5
MRSAIAVRVTQHDTFLGELRSLAVRVTQHYTFLGKMRSAMAVRVMHPNTLVHDIDTQVHGVRIATSPGVTH